MNKIVCILSGGLDSTTMVYDAVRYGYEVYALTFDYGQKHLKELECARKTAKRLGINHKIVDLYGAKALLEGSSLTSDIPIPEGHYQDENMKSTVVPNRNMIMLALAAGYSISIGAYKVAYGAHGGDHPIYPDTRPEFVKAMQDVLRLCDYKEVTLITPYLYDNKDDIVQLGSELGVQFEETWTCYNGREKACGKCGSCTERIEAFRMNSLVDPIEYEIDISW